MRETLFLFLRGVAMGAVDLVPGVSAGTVAFITGIYTDLITSIKSINLEALKIGRSQGLAALWEHINGNFLVTLLAGILSSLFTLAGAVKFLLTNYPLPLWSFFIGLILASVIYLLRQHPPKTGSQLIALGLGLLVTYVLSVAPAIATEGNYLTMFTAGSIAMCAMILPGISGSYILVLLGLYSVFIDALVNAQWDLLAVFAAGGITGLMLFSRLLSWLLDNYSTTVINTLCGFLIGSLTVIWPWKQVATTTLSSGKTLVVSAGNLSPSDYRLLVGQDPQLFSCITAVLAGLALVLVLEFLGNRSRKLSG